MTHTHALIESAVQNALARHWPEHAPRHLVAPVKSGQHGDYTSSLPLTLSKALGLPPRTVAQILANAVSDALPEMKVEVAGAGFVNFTLRGEALLDIIHAAADPDYGLGEERDDIILEYGSANPTGPLHIGHARGLVVGSSLANLLRYAGHTVRTEYYVNDAGAQVCDLAQSVLFRAREITGAPQTEPRPAYPGSYVLDCAEALLTAQPEAVTGDAPDTSPQGPIARFAVAWCLGMIRADLHRLGVHFDAFVRESAFGQRDAAVVIGRLRAYGMVVDAALPPQPGKPAGGPRPVFLSTRFGDDKDRALMRDDGSLTYFANDIVNHARKANLAPRLITLLGEDHSGYVARITAAVAALGTGATLETPLVGTVHLIRDGQAVSMSKRAGTFETVRDLLDAVPVDAVRMSLLDRTPDGAISFDLDAAAADGPKSPVWAVNYAHARLTSVLSKAPEGGEAQGEMSAPEREVARLVADWPRLVSAAAAAREPHRVAGFCRELADAVNAWWSAGNADTALRIVQEMDPPGTARRVAVARAAKGVLGAGLRILGIAPAQEMWAGEKNLR